MRTAILALFALVLAGCQSSSDTAAALAKVCAGADITYNAFAIYVSGAPGKVKARDIEAVNVAYTTIRGYCASGQNNPTLAIAAVSTAAARIAVIYSRNGGK